MRYFFEKDGQIERRWDNEIRLEPYRWVDCRGRAMLEEQADFIGIVGALQSASPVPFLPDLDVSREDEAEADAAALRFFFASQGVIGLLKKLHKMAFRIASRSPSERRVIDIGAVDALAEGDLVELLQHGAVEALHDAVIRHVGLGAPTSLLPLRGAALW